MTSRIKASTSRGRAEREGSTLLTLSRFDSLRGWHPDSDDLVPW